jgi:hypothetical protein
MLCELSQMQLKSAAVGQQRLQKMSAFELKEHDEKLNRVIEQCKAREPHKFWSDDEIRKRSSDWKGTQYERRMMAQLRVQSERKGL